MRCLATWALAAVAVALYVTATDRHNLDTTTALLQGSALGLLGAVALCVWDHERR
jgi:hypothetical protein